MDKYIQQLVEDLEAAAQNPPTPSYYEVPPGFEDQPFIAELGLVPFKTIEELTGIKEEAFPDFHDLQARHWRAVLNAIFKVFDSLKIKLIDAPKGIPKEWLYEAITSNWQYDVQFLPQTGMDLELCIGDSIDCPYGLYCSCEIEWPDDEEYFELNREIPEKYVSLLPKIAEAIDSDWVCILYGDTLELKTISQEEYYYPSNSDEFFELISRVDDNIFSFSDMFTFEPLLDYERELIMEDFATDLRDEPLRGNLFAAFDTKNPIKHFNDIVLQSVEKQNWIAFKQKWIEEHVRAIIWQNEREKSLLPEGINGFFNDDGTRIDPSTVPIPRLCENCQSYKSTDPEENILCILNRNDQRDEPYFKCGSFEKI
jgi:hypothetical protein